LNIDSPPLVQRLRYEKDILSYVSSVFSPQLQHAVLAAEGARFFHHHGFHRKEIVNAVGEDLEGNRSRGGIYHYVTTGEESFFRPPTVP
jgi:hypothetical protein